MIHGIHSVFPPTSVTCHSGDNCISEKKLADGEGTWSFHKEILGWEFDGLHRTITLPHKKCNKIVHLIKLMLKKPSASLKSFQQLAGKLQHAAFGIPGGPGLFSQIDRAMHGDPQMIPLTPTIKECLSDWRYLIQHLSQTPTHVCQLCKDMPHYIGYSNACGLGAGGVLCRGTDTLFPVMWQLRWPPDIIDQVTSATNKSGDISINDLELVGLVLN